MKKGRPALTLDVLCPAGRQEEFAGHIMSLTSAIGMRVIPVGKIAAERSMDQVSVLGREIGVKVARWRGAWSMSSRNGSTWQPPPQLSGCRRSRCWHWR